MLDFASYEKPAPVYQHLGVLCTAYGRIAHKTAECPPRRLGCYAAVWVSSGSGWLETEATPHRMLVGSGSLLWLFPGVRHCYGADAGGWAEQWVLFEGAQTRAFEHLGFLSPTQPLQQIKTPAAIEVIFTQIYADYLRGGPQTGVLSGSLISQLVIVAHQQTVEALAEHDPIRREIERGKRWLESHAFEDCQIEEVAAACHMGYSTFRRHFKNQMGCSPKEYLVLVRLRRAKELLAFTQQSIAEIARHVGFADPYYFSRIFHEKEGLTPTLFRVQQPLSSSNDNKYQ